MFFILPVLHTHFPKITLQISSKLTHLFISYSIKQHEENFYYFSNNFDLNNINNQKHSNIDNSNFENPKRVVKLDVILEDKTKSDNLVSPNRSSWLNNYEQFQNSVDFNKEIAHNVTLSNKSTNSKDSTNISFTKDRSNESVRDQITSSQYLTEPSINSNQKNLLETEKLSRTDQTLLQLPLSEIPRSKRFLVTNYQDNSTINTTCCSSVIWWNQNKMYGRLHQADQETFPKTNN